MKTSMKILGWLLLALWIAFVAFVGPAMVSSTDSVVVGGGFVLAIGLLASTIKYFSTLISKELSNENE